MTTVAIHQPNFFPWLGYFDKIARSDIFIFLDHVQFQKTGGIWSNRVKLLFGGEAHWATAPIVRNYHGYRLINEMEFQAKNPWRLKLIKSLATNYGRAPFFVNTMEILEPLILNTENNLAKYNGATVLAIAKHLGMPSEKFYWSSALNVENQASEMLISLTKEVGGNSYLCGGGADGYQNDAMFEAEGIELIYQNFQHPSYTQHGLSQSTKGLSIIDALMNLGVGGVHELLQMN